jgi:glutathione-independent formaldehyde dehydrogenase
MRASGRDRAGGALHQKGRPRGVAVQRGLRFLFHCSRGHTNSCLVANPQSTTAGYGYAGMGPYRGGQAEYLRVPFADFNCLKLPGSEDDEYEDDFVLLADIFPTAWHATELAAVHEGDSVAVYGAGPVGLLSAYSALLRGTAEVYMVDRASERLTKAESMGATPVDFTRGARPSRSWTCARGTRR